MSSHKVGNTSDVRGIFVLQAALQVALDERDTALEQAEDPAAKVMPCPPFPSMTCSCC